MRKNRANKPNRFRISQTDILIIYELARIFGHRKISANFKFIEMFSLLTKLQIDLVTASITRKNVWVELARIRIARELR